MIVDQCNSYSHACITTIKCMHVYQLYIWHCVHVGEEDAIFRIHYTYSAFIVLLLGITEADSLAEP